MTLPPLQKPINFDRQLKSSSRQKMQTTQVPRLNLSVSPSQRSVVETSLGSHSNAKAIDDIVNKGKTKQMLSTQNSRKEVAQKMREPRVSHPQVLQALTRQDFN